MGMAGGVQAIRLGAIEPYGTFGLSWSVDVLALVIIGGLGMRLGPLVGAVFFVILDELLADLPSFHLAITGVILIAVIRFAPKGVCGFLGSMWSTLDSLRRPASEVRA
jgi:branched-chain amino acid transport system permease protein